MCWRFHHPLYIVILSAVAGKGNRLYVYKQWSESEGGRGIHCSSYTQYSSRSGIEMCPKSFQLPQFIFLTSTPYNHDRAWVWYKRYKSIEGLLSKTLALPNAFLHSRKAPIAFLILKVMCGLQLNLESKITPRCWTSSVTVSTLPNRHFWPNLCPFTEPDKTDENTDERDEIRFGFGV